MSDKASSPLSQSKYPEQLEIVPLPAGPFGGTFGIYHETEVGGRALAICYREADAQRIFNAVRAHDDLLAALTSVRAALNCHYDSAVIESEYGAVIDAAIAKAGGQIPGPITLAEDLERR